MNPEQPLTPREELEIKITALLLGELDASEADRVRQAIASDPELSQLHHQLEQTLGLLKEASTDLADETEPLRLPEEKRDALLARFKTITPKEFQNPKRPSPSIRLIEVAAVLAIIGVMSAMLLPSLSKAKHKAQRVTELNNLRQMEIAKLQATAAHEFERTTTSNPNGSINEANAYFAAGYAYEPTINRQRDADYDIALPPQISPQQERGDLQSTDGRTEFNRRANGVDSFGWYGAVTADDKNYASAGEPLGRPTELDRGSSMAGYKPVSDGLVTDLYADSSPTPGFATPASSRARELHLGLSRESDHNLGEHLVAEEQMQERYFADYGAGGTTLSLGHVETPATPSEAKQKGTTTWGFPQVAKQEALGYAVVEDESVVANRSTALGDLPTMGRLFRSTSDKVAQTSDGQLDQVSQEPASSDNWVRGVSTVEGIPVKKQPQNLAPARRAGRTTLSAGVGVTSSDRENLRRLESTRDTLNIANGGQVAQAGGGGGMGGGGAGRTDRFIAGKEVALQKAPSSSFGIALPESEDLPQSGLESEPLPSSVRFVGDIQVHMKRIDVITGLPRRPILHAENDHGTVISEAEVSGDDALPLAWQDSMPARKPSPKSPTPQPEVQTSQNPFSTFSLNVSDVSFKLAAASLEQGQMPDVATVRSEEFLNAFDYRDPAPAPGQPLAFAWERARYPFAHNRDLLRFSVQTAARGREPGRPLNLVLLLDNSGSMERSDRVRIIRECLNVLSGQLTPQDKVSVIAFARTARLWVDGVPGVQAAASLNSVGQLTPEGGTNLEEAMNLAYATAHRHHLANGVNRVVLLTDGAANLGNVDPESLQQMVEAQRKQGIALDCFGIGWEGYNDNLLELLARNGDGRYGFVNTPQDAGDEFAAQLAGALQVAASDVKMQVEFNPHRVTAYRQIGYAKHQLTKEQFRDNTVDAAEIGAAESGNALYVVETNPQGHGPVATVRARFKVPATGQYKEYEWSVPYTGQAIPLENASAAMRLAASANAFSEWLVASPYAGEVSPDRLLNLFRGVPEVFGVDRRPTKLERMIREAKQISGE